MSRSGFSPAPDDQHLEFSVLELTGEAMLANVLLRNTGQGLDSVQTLHGDQDFEISVLERPSNGPILLKSSAFVCFVLILSFMWLSITERKNT